MNYFHSIREAKDFIISRIVEEAQREGVPLSELERKMLYFSEGEMSQAEADLCAEFDRDVDQGCYEQKIANLIKKIDRRYRTGDHQEYARWRSATQMLLQEDHYLGLMITQAKLRPPWDFLKLVGTAILVVGAFTGGVFLLLNWGIEPSPKVVTLVVWATIIGFAVLYPLVGQMFGENRSRRKHEAHEKNP